MRLNAIDWLAITLVIIGGINWGLVGIFDYNLVTDIFGRDSFMSTLIFALVGLAAIWLVYTVSKLASRSNTATTA